ncbi:RNA-binding cell elongation regulator Jag/EloR [Tepidimicrobium xylanilyticum]|uniref:RNA-binding protein KhpB n=1 Tax=Tepidimicrobium xylanilyticum TaxID=1123352 RepID=A0A1H3AJC7_9FIRM|nr:RNA-binding cell elongation regulator Jag/EloR [Tepidimicrobium xylanilyticum]GMG98072.1 DNA/RNA-binding protein [Tepidimicrobium xylanilyticum]SDX29541.1 spoIIIJ-associated protein [Tepidimicrobium xylanilyticum]
MRSVVKVAKTVREAIDNALDELNLSESDVKIEVLEEPSKGLFGLLGAKDAVVRVTVVNDPIEIVENFLSKILLSMRIKGTVMAKRENNIINVEIMNINSSDMGIIIGKRGNTLDAIQYLLSLSINRNREDYIKVILDVKGYRKKREETLIKLANRMAEKSKLSKKPIKLEPMNPYERRIIHSALQNVSGVSTYSEGEEPYRRVIIQAK